MRPLKCNCTYTLLLYSYYMWKPAFVSTLVCCYTVFQRCANWNKSKDKHAHQRGFHGCRNTPCFQPQYSVKRRVKFRDPVAFPTSETKAELRTCYIALKLWLLCSLTDKSEQRQPGFLVVLADKARGTFPSFKFYKYHQSKELKQRQRKM